MTHKQIEDEILKTTKRIDKFIVRISLWHGDGAYREDEYGNSLTVVYNVIDLLTENEDRESLDHCIHLKSDDVEERKDTDENIKILRKEQKQIANYLIKRGYKVELYEGCV